GWGQPGAINHVVHYVYAAHGAGSDAGDVYYIRSTDSGMTFSAALKLNTDATALAEWEPNLSVSPGGTVFAVWYDERNGGNCTAGLCWCGATSRMLSTRRNGVLIATVRNTPSSYTDNTGQKGRATFTYQVCNAGTQNCSNQVTVRF